jgi:hypothetical protein
MGSGTAAAKLILGQATTAPPVFSLPERSGRTMTWARAVVI